MSFIGNQPKYSAYQPNYFTGDGVTVSFLMDEAVSTSGSIIVVIDGVKQLANTYNVSNKTLVFSEAPPAGSKIEVNFLAIKGQTSIVTAAKGGGSDAVFYENSNVITQSYTITAGHNAGTFGPVLIVDGVVISIPDGSTWSVV